MKLLKTLMMAIVTIAVFSACSKNNDVNPKGSKISPPDWIIGSWGDGKSVNYVFRKDDFCYVSVGFETCFKAQVELYKNVPDAQMKMVVEQQGNSDSYLIKITQLGSTMSYQFYKKSSNEIIWRHDGYDLRLVKM